MIMEWESPIHMNYQHHIQEINKTIEGEIMKAVVAVGVDVDKDRLLKALQDSKSFYEEGYYAGMRDAVPVVHGRWVVENEESIRCSGCCFNRASIKMPLDYCPNCGADMRGE